MATSKFQDQYNDPNPPKEKGKRQTTKILGLTFLAVAVVLGSTFASRINITGGTPVEFGQGLVVTAACSGSDFITVTPIATYDTPTSHYFLSDVTFSHIPDSCIGKDLSLTTYTDTTTLELDTGVTSARVIYAGASTSLIYTGECGTTAFAGTITGAGDTAGYGTFNLRLDGAKPRSEDVQKMTLISSDPGCVNPGGPKDGTEAQPGDSAYQILQDYPGSPDGIYWIQNANINGGNKFKIYADMTRNGGGWTLIVANANSIWSDAETLGVNQTNPPTNPSSIGPGPGGLIDTGTKYSILSWADYIKRSASGFQYRIEAGTFGHTGGVWTANQNYSFISTNTNNSDIHLDVRFDSWTAGGGSLGDRMPFYYPGSGILGTLSTSDSPDSYWWGALITARSWTWNAAGIEAVPMINMDVQIICAGLPTETGVCTGAATRVWYWVR